MGESKDSRESCITVHGCQTGRGQQAPAFLFGIMLFSNGFRVQEMRKNGSVPGYLLAIEFHFQLHQKGHDGKTFQVLHGRQHIPNRYAYGRPHIECHCETVMAHKMVSQCPRHRPTIERRVKACTKRLETLQAIPL